MPSIRVNKVASELQVGVHTLTEFLSKQFPDKTFSVNSKLTEDEFKQSLRKFGKDLGKNEREALTSKYLSPAPKQKELTTPSASKDSDKNNERKTGPIVKGKIELDEKGNVIQPKKEVVSTSTKSSAGKDIVEKEKTANVEKDQITTKGEEVEKVKPAMPKKEVAPKTEVKAKKIEPTTTSVTENKSPEAVETEPKKDAMATNKQEEEQKKKVKEKEVKEPTTNASTPKVNVTDSAKKSEPKTIEQKTDSKPSEKLAEEKAPTTKEAPKESNVYRIGTNDNVGVTVVGKVDLTSIESNNKRRRRKRERIKGGKVDVAKQTAQQKQQSTTGEKKDSKNKNQSSQANKNNKRPNDTPRNDKRNQGRKAKRRQKIEQKPEITQEDIQKQIKETMAAIQGGRKKATNQSARYRREKRDAHRKEQSLLEQEMRQDKTLQLTEYVTANDLAQMMDVSVNDIITLCFSLGMMVSINQRLEKDTIDLIVEEFGYKAEYVEAQMLDMIETEEDSEEDLEPRAPIVTVMGHVDHGKTSLLDSIRNADVTKGEAGGITQHVGAYSVTLENGRKITFLDTPGHEAFTAMRARGAKVTDIVIIVVAADDGVMPQTKEALSHASLANVPIIFAINKVDKPQSNPDRIKEELANLNYLVEDWGGKYQSQEISAKKGIGIHELLEKVLLEADIMELRANPDKKAIGSVLESTMEQGRGYTTKVLIQEGTLHMGDHIIAGANYGRVKALFNERGQNVESVGPSEPVKVLGLNGATQAGEILNVLDTEAEVRDIATRRGQLKREQRERTQRLPSLMDLGRRIAEGQIQELNIIVKGDMDGSVEALSDSIVKLSTGEIRVNVIHKAVGQISESDVILASASDAIVIGFQVRPTQGARRLAEEEGVEIRTYSIIYDAINDVTTAMEGMLSPEIKEKVTANIEVREVYKISKVGTIAGCYVQTGKVSRTDKIRVIRDGIVIHTGELGSLKRFKDDVKEVSKGFECGLNIANFNDINVGDIIEAYEEVKVKREL